MSKKTHFSTFIFCLLATNLIFGSSGEPNSSKKGNHVIESSHENLPTSLSISLDYLGEKLTLELEKSAVFGENTKFLIDNGTNKLIKVDNDIERTYIGSVAEYQNYFVSAVMTNKGLIATINRPNQESLEVRPSDTGNYIIKTSENCSHQCVHHTESTTDHHDVVAPLEAGITNEATSPISVKNLVLSKSSIMMSTATLRPTRVMNVREFEIGVEIGSRAFLANSSYGGNLAMAQASAQSIVGNLNSRYLRGAGIRFKLGTVIIRTTAASDPLRNSVVSTGTSANAGSSLAAFRDYWNNNPNEVGTTHDLAVYHVLSSPSGLAYVNSVGSNNRYGTMGGNGPTSWANGTAVHEVGHSLNLRHTNASGLFYEFRPRRNAGANSAGGREFSISVMDGSGNNNIGRLATSEAARVINTKESKRAFGTLISNPGVVPPFGVFDRVRIAARNTPGTFDVIANDYDANNDVLDLRLLDTRSQKGGSLSISEGTGPGGRNQITYTPPSSGLSGEDFFHYTVFDTAGRTDFGTVYVTSASNTNAPVVNSNSDRFQFDLGAASSAVFSNYIGVTNTTQTPVYGWTNTSNLESRDRGAGSGVNNINRDFILSTQARTFETTVTNGIWNVLVTFGDRNFPHDNMQVRAEGVVKLSNVSTNTRQFLSEGFKTEVRDGKLSLEFSDQGGASKYWVVTRIILTKEPDTLFQFDLGTDNSIVFPNYTRITNRTQTAAYGWTNTANIETRDRGATSGVNNINRDFVLSTQARTFETTVANGTWNVLVTFGDRNFPHDNMQVRAEGVVRLSNINTNTRQFLSEGFTTEVRDGKLSLEFSDQGGVSDYWVVTRIRLTRRLAAKGIFSEEDSLTKKENQKFIALYPNPTTGIFTLDLSSLMNKKIDYAVIDISGKTLIEGTFNENHREQESVDVSTLENGVYFVKNENFTATFVKK